MQIGDRVKVKCVSSKQGQVGTIEYQDTLGYVGTGSHFRVKFPDSKLVFWFREVELEAMGSELKNASEERQKAGVEK